VWVDGVTPGSNPDITLTYKDSQGNTLAQDEVKVLVTETVSKAPKSSVGHIWCGLAQLGDDDGEEFENGITPQGFSVTWFRDSQHDDDNFEDCTFENYKELCNCGALHVICHGEVGLHYAVYADTLDACVQWIGDEEDMEAVDHPQWGPGVAVSSSWLRNNFSATLNTNRAITHWAICRSATAGLGRSVKEAAGGRWCIGYRNVTSMIECLNTARRLLKRMNGTWENGTLRTVGEAWAAGAFSDNVRMDGNKWTTLCPVPIEQNATWPDSDPGERHGWGCIIFDTYMDDTASAEDALVCTSGGPISDQSWCGDTGYGKFVLGFNYDNTSGGGASLKAVADYCTDHGGKKMDGDRVADNGDDRTWDY